MAGSESLIPTTLPALFAFLVTYLRRTPYRKPLALALVLVQVFPFRTLYRTPQKLLLQSDCSKKQGLKVP